MRQSSAVTFNIWQRDHWKVISKSRMRPSWTLAIVKITSIIFSSPPVFCSHLYGKCTSIRRVCMDGTCLKGESFLGLSPQVLCRWWVQLDLMRLEAHVGDVRSVHTYSMYTCSACLHASLCMKRIEPVYKCDIHTYPCCALETAHPTHFTWGSTDAPPCSNGSCHSVIDGAWWAQLVPSALTHLLLTWGNTSPLLVLIGRRLIGSIDNVNTFIENQD